MATATTTLSPQQIGDYLHEALQGDVLEVVDSFGTARVTVRPEALPRAVRLCKSDPRLRFDFFDWLSAVDEGEEGFAVLVSLYSVTHKHHVALRAMAPGGREDPRMPSLSGIYRGVNWHEREVYDMFGITFEGHPGLLPRLLTVENFEGWPLRKDFLLATRAAKPWPGAKEPEEHRDEPGPAQSVAVVGNAEPLSAEQKTAAAAAKSAPVQEPAAREEVDYDQALYEQLLAEGKSERIARSRAKAAALRARKAGASEPAPVSPVAADTGAAEGAAAGVIRAGAGDPVPSSPEGAAAIAEQDFGDPSIAKDAAAGAVGGDVAAGAPGDVPEVDQPVPDMAAEARLGTGAPPAPGATPGAEAQGRHTGAVEQSGAKPAAETPGMTSASERPPERGQGGDLPNTTPAPGPESDTPPPGGGRPGAERADDRVPLTPQPGAEAAPLPEDAPLLPEAEESGVSETPLVHEHAMEPRSAPGTDADRGGRLSRDAGSADEREHLGEGSPDERPDDEPGGPRT